MTSKRYLNDLSKTGCFTCSGNPKRTIDEIKLEALKDGNTCISEVYVNSKEKLTFLCPDNHEYKMRWNDFQGGHRCKFCRAEYISAILSGENHYNYNSDRTRRVRTDHLSFNLYKIHLLKDDPNYELLLESRKTTNRFKKNEFSVDHIFPRIAFVDNDLDIKYGPDVVKNICNLRENLQILKREENGNKSGKYNQEEFMKWFEEKLNT